MAQGKRVILKDQVLITTENLYEKLKRAEKETKKKKNTTSNKKHKRVSEATSTSENNAKKSFEDEPIATFDEIEVMIV